MQKYTTIELNISKQVAIIWLNRTEVHNAFNDVMVNELIQCFTYVEQLNDIRVIILRGKGKSFCSGADLQWLGRPNQGDYGANLAESMKMADCFHAIYESPKPTIAVVHGNVYGGANGFMCACDLAMAVDDTKFSFPELRVGIVPATILPYVLQRVNQHKAKWLMYTGKVINAPQAFEAGLIDYLCPENELEGKIQELISNLLKSGPYALMECKSLINKLSGKMVESATIKGTAELITKIKMSKEGQEGILAFFEKRPPDWNNEH
jgi:methylglutaconyl-CoA hydratase